MLVLCKKKLKLQYSSLNIISLYIIHYMLYMYIFFLNRVSGTFIKYVICRSIIIFYNQNINYFFSYNYVLKFL
jgi:hypothetical protein